MFNAIGFEAHVALILEKFKESYVWADKDKSRIAMFVTDALAGLSENNQAYAAFALREAFLHKARRESSTAAGVRFLGVMVNRNKGSIVDCLLRNNDTIDRVLEKGTVFQIDGRDFYAIERTNIPAKSARTCPLRQGTPAVKTFDLNTIDLDFPEIMLDEPGFIVSSDDLVVYSENKTTKARTYYTKLEDEIFDTLFSTTSADNIFIETTTSLGDCSLTFGNGVFGARLNRGDNLVVRYVKTMGAASNIGRSGLRVTSQEDRYMSGVTTGPATGGDNKQDLNVLKQYAPHIFESHKSWIRPAHWVANIANYPDVADVVVQSQRDIDPEDVMWMNVVRICILPKNSPSWGGANPNPRSAQWEAFAKYVKKHTLGQLTIQTYNPEKILADIDIEVFVYEGENRSVWQDRLQAKVDKFFTRRKGMLGRTIDPSDLHDICTLDEAECRYEGIDYVSVVSPAVPIVPRSQVEYVVPRRINVQVKYTSRKEL